ncbi:hypothetical protein [Selenomonas ruminis]|uniref:Uncharacterized protein n=1 Tax=Selenomonas ruminis TaxID=2593411 RepID=A0A5D6WA67_9FIRM|nr:hypothetical protein [Selenomonas sp. mPRGC5]TYZ24806.1 hypothetical protein FZ040_01840 [Selenomonas sp. mPRGC5]
MRVLNDSVISLTGSLAKALSAKGNTQKTGRGETSDSAEISEAARALQEKAQAKATKEPEETMDWLDVIDRGNGKFTARFRSTAEISRVVKLGYMMVNGQKVTLDKQQQKELMAAGKQMEKDRQNVMNQFMMEQQLSSARQSADGWKKAAQQQSRVTQTAIRLMHGRHVSPADEKELAEFSSELYAMAKSAGALERIREDRESRERDRKISEDNARQRAEEQEPKDYSTKPLSDYPTYETQVAIDMSGDVPQIGAAGEVTIPPAGNS